MTINSLAPKVLTQNLADREFCLNLGDFWKWSSDRWRLLAKRESRYRSKDGEFSGGKRELIATNSLMDVLTQIERISNLISSYPARIRTWTKRTKISYTLGATSLPVESFRQATQAPGPCLDQTN